MESGQTMMGYIVKRLFLMVPTLIGITVITFAIIQFAPGDPALMKLGVSGAPSFQEASKIVSETRQYYALNKPLYVQYFSWVNRLIHFDFGNSFSDGRPVLEKIFEALPITLTLNFLALSIIYLVSIPWGVFTAIHNGSFWDRFTAAVLFFLYSLPSFWVAMLLITYLGGGDYLNWFPIVGIASADADQLSLFAWLGDVLWHLILPLFCLTYSGFAFLSRFSHSTMLEVVNQDYIRTARAKGLSEWSVIFKHGLRNALIPQLTLFGTLLPVLISGSVIIEQIFSIPGMGRLSFEAVLSRDYPLIMAITVLSAVLTLLGILISDLLYMVADPRVSFRKKT